MQSEKFSRWKNKDSDIPKELIAKQTMNYIRNETQKLRDIKK